MNISEVAVIYHWWDDTETKLLDSLFPIIPSIASLRAVSDVQIYVLDISKKKRNWSKYSKSLNFEVIPFISELDSRDLSKPFDLDKFSSWINQKIIVSCDSDVFWVKSLFPFEKDYNKFCCNTNTGYFYYNKEFPKWMKLWQFYTLNQSVNIKKYVENHYNRNLMNNFINTEIIHQYLLLDPAREEDRKGLFEILSIKEHFTPYMPIPKDFNMIHFCGFINSKRHLFPFLIEEMYKNIVNLVPEYLKYKNLKKISVKDLDFDTLVNNLLTEKKTWTNRYF